MATAQRSLQRGEVRILAILGVPTFALALAIPIPAMAPLRDEPR